MAVAPEIVDEAREGHMNRGHKGEKEELVDEFGGTELTMGRDRDHQAQPAGEMPDISKLSVLGEIVTRVSANPPLLRSRPKGAAGSACCGKMRQPM